MTIYQFWTTQPRLCRLFLTFLTFLLHTQKSFLGAPIGLVQLPQPFHLFLFGIDVHIAGIAVHQCRPAFASRGDMYLHNGGDVVGPYQHSGVAVQAALPVISPSRRRWSKSITSLGR